MTSELSPRTVNANSWWSEGLARSKESLSRFLMGTLVLAGALFAMIGGGLTFATIDSQNQKLDAQTYQVVKIELSRQIYCVQVVNMILADFKSDKVKRDGLEFAGKRYKVIKAYGAYDENDKVIDEHAACQKKNPGSRALVLEDWPTEPQK